jgi:hypothetical protein
MAMQETPAPALPSEANQNDGSSATSPEEMARANAVTSIPVHAELNTQEAADAERRAVLAELAAYDQELGL